MSSPTIYVLIAALFLFSFVMAAVVFRMIAKAAPHEALVLTGTQPRVRFGHTLVVPVLQQVFRVDLRAMPLHYVRRDQQSLHCRDNFRVDAELVAIVAVEPTERSILLVHQRHANTAAAATEYFQARLVESLRSVLLQFDSTAIATERERILDLILEKAGADHDGYRILRLALHTSPTAKRFYDSSNILDATALAKMAEQELIRVRRSGA